VKKPKPIPFDFVLEQLGTLDVHIRPMFGCHALYVREKIVMILRKKENAEDNGVWIATTSAHHKSLKKELPSMRSIKVFGSAESAWQMLPSDADDFEENVMRACDLILHNDPRIGKIPKQKKKKKKKS
jgi:hypothetical protein